MYRRKIARVFRTLAMRLIFCCVRVAAKAKDRKLKNGCCPSHAARMLYVLYSHWISVWVDVEVEMKKARHQQPSANRPKIKFVAVIIAQYSFCASAFVLSIFIYLHFFRRVESLIIA